MMAGVVPGMSVPEDAIERAGEAAFADRHPDLRWERVAESVRETWRGNAEAALVASGLSARVAELEAALAPFAALAKVIDALRHEPGSTCPHRLAADDIRRARAALDAKGAPDER